MVLPLMEGTLTTIGSSKKTHHVTCFANSKMRMVFKIYESCFWTHRLSFGAKSEDFFLRTCPLIMCLFERCIGCSLSLWIVGMSREQQRILKWDIEQIWITSAVDVVFGRCRGSALSGPFCTHGPKSRHQLVLVVRVNSLSPRAIFHPMECLLLFHKLCCSLLCGHIFANILQLIAMFQKRQY